MLLFPTLIELMAERNRLLLIEKLKSLIYTLSAGSWTIMPGIY